MFEEDRFNDIITKYRDWLLKHCASKLKHDYFAAEEITNDVFVIMYQKWDTLRFTGVKTWLIKTADYQILHYLRDKKVEDPLDDFNDQRLPSELMFINFEEAVLDEYYINTILKSLDDTEKIIFRYRYIDGMTLSEIAETTHIAYSTVRLRLTNIADKIKTLMEVSNI